MTNLKKSQAMLVLVLFLFSLINPVTAQAAESEVKDSFNPASLPSFGAPVKPEIIQAGETIVTKEEIKEQVERITLDLKGVDILDVLKILGQRSNLNIVAGQNVRGNVTLYLKDVPIRDALDTITDTLNLSYVEEDGIINVMSDQIFEGAYGLSADNGFINRIIRIRYVSEDDALKIVEQLKSPKGKVTFDPRTRSIVLTDRAKNIDEIEATLAEVDQPLETRVFTIQYADVEALATELQSHMTPDISIMNVDKRTNQISVTDRPENIQQVDKVVNAFDLPPKQVLIEAKIVEVALTDAHRSGIDWEYVKTNLGAFDNFTLKPNFNLAAPAAALGGGGLSTFTLDGGVTGMQTILNLLQKVGRTDTLSTPRVTVLNNEEAKLVDAKKQPYISQTVVQSLNSAQTSDNVQFVDVGVTLAVIPTIADEEMLVLRMKPEVSTQTGSLELQSVAEGSDTTFTRSSIPIVSSQSLETTVLVKSGETLVVGGLIKDKKAKERGKLPVVSNLPLLGRLFQSEAIDYEKTELVIFLTPYILKNNHRSIMKPAQYEDNPPAIQIDGVVIGDPGSVVNQIEDPIVYHRQPYWNKDENKKNDEGSQAIVSDYKRVLTEKVRQRLVDAGYEDVSRSAVAFLLHIGPDGSLKRVSFLDASALGPDVDRSGVLQAILEGGSFPSIPWDSRTHEEAFDIWL